MWRSVSLTVELLAHKLYGQLISEEFWANEHDTTTTEEAVLYLLEDQLEPVREKFRMLIEYFRRKYENESGINSQSEHNSTIIKDLVRSFIEKMQNTVDHMILKPFTRFAKSYKREANLKPMEEIDIAEVPQTFSTIITACWNNLQTYFQQGTQHIGDDIKRLYNLNLVHNDPENVPHSYIFISPMFFVDGDDISYDEADSLRAQIYDSAILQIENAAVIVTDAIKFRSIPNVIYLVKNVFSFSDTAFDTLKTLNGVIEGRLHDLNQVTAIRLLFEHFLNAINEVANNCIIEIVKIFDFCQRADVYHIRLLNNRRFDHVTGEHRQRQRRRYLDAKGSNLKP